MELNKKEDEDNGKAVGQIIQDEEKKKEETREIRHKEESVIHKLKNLDIDKLGRLVDVSMSITGIQLMCHEYH